MKTRLFICSHLLWLTLGLGFAFAAPAPNSAQTPAASASVLPVEELKPQGTGTAETAGQTVPGEATPAIGASARTAVQAEGNGQEPYRLNAGDVIEIKSTEDPSLNEQVRIGPDGMISYALVGYVRASGYTLQEMDDALTAELRKVIREPKITIFVREYASQVVYVGGEVKSPREVRIAGSLNPLGAVFSAGGFTGGADRNRVTLIRKGTDGKPESRSLDLDREPDSAIELRGFDVIIVPPTAIAGVDLWVEQYINGVVPRFLSAGFTYAMGHQFILQ